ncbi:MAG: hypothetical protein KIT31_05545 [Deltaproteobacteria bacterium]|nr:hypothetical protein [Deltaproteobacteria bacterium]
MLEQRAHARHLDGQDPVRTSAKVVRSERLVLARHRSHTQDGIAVAGIICQRVFEPTNPFQESCEAPSHFWVHQLRWPPIDLGDRVEVRDWTRR